MSDSLTRGTRSRSKDLPGAAKQAFGPRHILVAMTLAAIVMVPIWGVIWWLLP